MSSSIFSQVRCWTGTGEQPHGSCDHDLELVVQVLNAAAGQLAERRGKSQVKIVIAGRIVDIHLKQVLVYGRQIRE